MYLEYCVQKLSKTSENWVFQSQKYPKSGLFGPMDIIRKPSSANCDFFMRLILYYHCICIRSIVSKNNPKPVRIGASRDNNNQQKALKLPFYASLMAIKN